MSKQQENEASMETLGDYIGALLTVGGGLVGFGAIKSTISRLQTDVREASKTVADLRDRVSRIEGRYEQE